MAISMFHGIKDDYVQVVVLQDRYHGKLQLMGWAKTPEELPDALAQPEPHDLPPQDGQPVMHEQNSDHKPALSDEVQLQIMAMDAKDEVELLLKETFGIKIDMRGSLDTVKEKAIGAINESGRAS